MKRCNVTRMLTSTYKNMKGGWTTSECQSFCDKYSQNTPTTTLQIYNQDFETGSKLFCQYYIQILSNLQSKKILSRIFSDNYVQNPTSKIKCIHSIFYFTCRLRGFWDSKSRKNVGSSSIHNQQPF